MATRTREWWEAPPEESAPRGYRLVPVDEPRGLSSAPKKDEGYGVGDIAKDAALSVLGKGAVGLGETVMGVADLATGGRAGRWAQEHLGYDPQAAKEQLSDWQSDTMKRHRAGYEQAKKSAEGLPLKDRLAAIAFGAMENPLVIADTIGESVPSIFAGGGVGGVAAKGLATRAGAQAGKQMTQRALARGLSEETAKKLGARASRRASENLIDKASTYTGALGEGVVGMGGAAEQLRQGKDELIAAEEKRRQENGLAPLTDAEKEQMRLFSGKDYGAALGTAGTTALFGAAGGKLGAKLGLADIETRVARGTAGLQGIGAQEAVQQAKRGILGRVLGGAAQEGLLEELPQSVTETLWQNWAQGKEDIWEGVDEAAVMGVLSGAAMGAGANIRGQRARGEGEPRGLSGAQGDDTQPPAAPPPTAPAPTDSSGAGGAVAPSAGAGASTSAQEQEAGDAAGGQTLAARGAAGEAEMGGAQAGDAGADADDSPSGAPDAAPRAPVSDALGAGAAVNRSPLQAAVLGTGAEDGGSAALSYEQLAQMRQGARDNRVRAAIAEELQARRAQVEAASTDELAALRGETGQGSAARTVIDRQLARRAGALSEDTAQALATDGAASALPDTDLAAAYDALTARLALSMQDGNQLPIPARGGALERVAGELDRRSGMDDATNAGGAFPLARSSWSDAVLQDIADYAYTPGTRAVAAGALAARRGDTEAASSWRNNIPPRRSDGQPAAFQQWQQEREQKRAARSDAANQLSDTLEQAKQQGGMLSGAAVDNADAIPALNEPRGFMPAAFIGGSNGTAGTAGIEPAGVDSVRAAGAEGVPANAPARASENVGAAGRAAAGAGNGAAMLRGAVNADGTGGAANQAAAAGAAPQQIAPQAGAYPAPQPTPDMFHAAGQGAATLPALSPTATPNQGALSDRTAGDRAAASSGELIAQGGAMGDRAGDRAPLTKAQEAEGERAFSAAQETLPGVRKLQGELMKVGFAPEAAATLAQMPWQQIPDAVRPAVYQALANGGLVRAQRGFTDGEYARVWRRLPEQARVQVLAQAGFADAAALARRAWAALPAKAKEAAKAAIDTGYRNWQRTEGEGSIPMPDAASQPSGAIERTQRSAIGRNAPPAQLGFDAGVNERAEARSRAEQAMNAAQRADEQARADVARWQALDDARRGAETARNPQPRKLRDGSKDAWRFQTSQVQPDAESARILQGAPVAQVRRADKLNGDKVEVARAAAEIFKQQGGKASRADIGDVVLDRNSAESSAFHGELTEVRRATFGAIQNVIERGALIAHAWHDNFESFYISAPITIDGVENIMTVTLRHSRSKHALYIHAVMLKENLLPGESSAAANASGRSGTEEAAGGFASVPEGIKNGKYERVEIRQRLRELLTMEATSNGKAAPASEQKKPAPKKKAGIEDFGEKLGGARKDAYAKARQTMERELSNSDIANLPMSEIFPASVVDAIEDVPTAALVKAMRDIIPRKPRGVLKVRWAAQVQQLRGLAQDLVSGRFSVEQMHERLLEPDSSTTGLRELSDKARLLEQIPREQWGRIGEVYSRRQYTPQGYNIPDGTVSLMLDGKLVGHIPQDELADRVRRLLEKDAPQKPTLQLEVRYNASEGVVFICKKGDRLMHRLKTFPYDKDGGRAALQKAANEATAFIKEHISELDAAWEKVKERENVQQGDERNAENRPREGRDWRGGKDATPEMFTQQFGFRGVEFGNWVGQGAGAKERQGLLNQAYDALMDLADIIGVDSRALSLNGSLGLSFGARGKGGKGAPNAHFESGKLVIALTKNKGAGALAHEWFHALDNYFSRQRGAGNEHQFITNNPWHVNAHKHGAEDSPNVRPAMREAFAALVRALNASPMAKRAENADKTRAKPYWSQTIERAARAFENYLYAKLEQRGQSNDYLANIRRHSDWQRAQESYPYLLPEEVAPVEQAFDALFAGMKQRETEKGVALFSRKKQTVPEKAAQKVLQSATPRRQARTLDEARQHAEAFIGRELTNESTGRTATVSRANLRKMTSEKAHAKSVDAAAHALAVANVDALFEAALLDHSHADRKGEPTIAAISRYVAPMVADGRVVAVKMTVKETTSDRQPNPIYSIEAVEIENPPSALSRANPDKTGIRPQAGFAANVLQRLQQVKSALAAQHGDAAMFSRSSAPASPLTAKQRSTVNRVKLMAASIRRVWQNAPDIEVVWDAQDARVPEAIRAQDAAMRSQGAEGDAEAVYHNGKVFVFASQVNTPRDMVRVVAHEVLGHHGLRGAFGRGMARVLNELMIARRAEVMQQAREYGLLDTDKLPAGVDAYAATDAQVWAAMSEHDRQQAAEEVLAHLAETYPQLPLVRRAIAAIRTWLRQHVPGFDRMGVSDDEIVRSFILPAREWVQQGMGVGTAPGTPLFRRAWHGGSAGIEREGFKLQKIGTGEGAQAFGWGMYFASQQRIADWYRKQYKIDHPERDAALYALEIPEDEDLLAWDAPLSESSVAVQRGVQQALQLHGTNIADLARALYPDGKGSAMGLVTGKDVYNALAGMAREAIKVPFGKDLGENMRRDRRAASVAQRSASEDLLEVGIPGLRYLDETSRERGEGSRDGRLPVGKRRAKVEGTHNYVIWDEALLTPEAAQITPMFSRSAQKSVEANITRGRAAMNRALLEKADQHRAMFRNGLGWVDFVWGDAKRGIQHMLERRQSEDGMTREEVERFLTENVPDVIAKGEEVRRNTIGGSQRAVLGLNGDEVVLVKNPGANAWMVSGWPPKKKTPGAKTAANDTAKATHRAADSSDGAAGAGVALWKRARSVPLATAEAAGAHTYETPARSASTGADSVSSNRASSQAGGGALFSRSRKPQTPEQRADALRYGGAGTASEQRMSFMESALAHAGRLFTHPGRVSLWDKTLGTPRHLAERVPAFKPVYEAAQRSVEDVSMLANMVMDAAPRWIPKLESARDLLKSAVSAKDSKAVAKPLFEGTLAWGRDMDGTLMRLDALEKKYAKMSGEDKAQALVKSGRVSQSLLAQWREMTASGFEAAASEMFEREVLQAGVVFTDAELRAEFGLNDQQISLYREARAAIDSSLDMTARTDMLRLVQHEWREDPYGMEHLRQLVLDAGSLDDAAQAIVQTLEHEAKLQADKSQPERAKVLRALAEDVGERLAKTQQLQRRGYAPLQRFGRYTVDVVDKASGERLYFGMYESRRESNLARIKLAQAFPNAHVTQGTLNEREFELFQGVTPETVELFGDMLRLEGAGDDAQDLAFQEYLRRTKNNHSALKHLIHRKGIAGYSEDVGRVLAAFIYANARAGSVGMNAGKMERAIAEIPKEQGELKDVAIGLRDYLKNPREGGHIVRGFLFAQYLGGSVASALVNATQPFQVTMPWLSQFGGMKRAAKYLAGALADMPRGKYEGDLAAALKAAEDDGTVSPQEIHHLLAQAQGVGSLASGDGTKLGAARALANNAWQRTKVAWGRPFAMAEQFNRRSTFIAAYRLARDRGMGDPEGFARKAVEETQFVYAKSNKPVWARGTIGGTLFCVDDTTEALTQRGWLGCDDLRPGDMLASFDMTTGRLKWMPMKSVHVFEHDGEMIHATAKTLDMLTTPDHRVVHYKQRRTPGAGRNAYHWELGVAEMQDIKASAKVQIPTAAPFDHEPVGEPIPDALVPLLGWVATEGCIHKKNRDREEWGGHITIGQNEGEKADMIRADLRAAGIPFKERYWRYENGNATHVNFFINKTNAAPLRELLPGKQITPEVLMRMSKAQIEVLVDRLLQGDGYVAKDGQRVFMQNPGATLETFQMALTILGKSYSVRKHGEKTKHVILREPKGREAGRYSISKMERVHYKGRVWCPIVPETSTWVARRNGLPFITHNTFKTYTVSYLELMHRMWTQGGKEGRRAVAWSVAMLLLVGGAGGLPFMEDAEDLIDGAGQLMGYNVSTKAWRDDLLRRTLGEELGGFLESGVSGLPGAPIDVAGRLGMGNLVPGTGLLLAKRDRSQDLKEMAGAAGDFVSRVYGGGKRALSGDFIGAALEMAPNAVRNAVKGVDMARLGMYRDSKGYKVIDTTAAEALAKFVGFQPGSVARVQEANSFMMRSKSFYQQKAADIRLEWAQALFEKDETKLARVRQKLADWNRKNPDQRITVDMRAIWRRVREMNKDRSQRIADTAPKALRRQMRELAAEARGEGSAISS